jgi:hypothetical protein
VASFTHAVASAQVDAVALEHLNLPLLPLSRSSGGGGGLGGGGGSDVAADGRPAEEKAAVKALHDFTVQAGGKYYLVEQSWWQQWKVSEPSRARAGFRYI